MNKLIKIEVNSDGEYDCYYYSNNQWHYVSTEETKREALASGEAGLRQLKKLYHYKQGVRIEGPHQDMGRGS